MAYIIFNGHQLFDISRLTLDIPPDVLKDLKRKLPLHVEAVLAHGYSKGKTRKTIVIGNTGRYSFGIYTSTIWHIKR